MTSRSPKTRNCAQGGILSKDGGLSDARDRGRAKEQQLGARVSGTINRAFLHTLAVGPAANCASGRASVRRATPSCEVLVAAYVFTLLCAAVSIRPPITSKRRRAARSAETQRAGASLQAKRLRFRQPAESACTPCSVPQAQLGGTPVGVIVEVIPGSLARPPTTTSALPRTATASCQGDRAA